MYNLLTFILDDWVYTLQVIVSIVKAKELRDRDMFNPIDAFARHSEGD